MCCSDRLVIIITEQAACCTTQLPHLPVGPRNGQHHARQAWPSAHIDGADGASRCSWHVLLNGRQQR